MQQHRFLSGHIIGVIGGNECGEKEYADAVEVGRRLAEAGAMIVCGGKSGVMEGVCKGAVEAGGITIGILPSDDISEANGYVKIPVASGLGIGRNIIIVRTAEALISIDGKYGTLSEIAFALQLGKPVISLRPWVEVPGIELAEDPQKAIELILNLITL